MLEIGIRKFCVIDQIVFLIEGITKAISSLPATGYSKPFKK
jgi:hypothetical protein